MLETSFPKTTREEAPLQVEKNPEYHPNSSGNLRSPWQLAWKPEFPAPTREEPEFPDATLETPNFPAATQEEP